MPPLATRDSSCVTDFRIENFDQWSIPGGTGIPPLSGTGWCLRDDAGQSEE